MLHVLESIATFELWKLKGAVMMGRARAAHWQASCELDEKAGQIQKLLGSLVASLAFILLIAASSANKTREGSTFFVYFQRMAIMYDNQAGC